MSDSESLDLSARDLMPNWVTDLEKPPGERKGKKETDGRPRKDQGKERPRRGKRGDFRDRSNEGFRGKKGGRHGSRDRRPPRDRERGGRRDRRGGERDGRRGRGRSRESAWEDSAPDIEVAVQPTPEAVKALARHIRGTGRAYAMADVARMILQARDRYQLEFRKAGQEDGKAGNSSKLYRCQGDGSLWLTRDEAVGHVLRSPLLSGFYSVEEIEAEPPRGNFTVIAVCGMSGRILGPPNHHEYQANVIRLHQERFSDWPLEKFKSRIGMHRDEETVEKWKAEVSRKRIYRVGPTAEEESMEAEKEEVVVTDEEVTTENVAEGPEEEPAAAAASEESRPLEETAEPEEAGEASESEDGSDVESGEETGSTAEEGEPDSADPDLEGEEAEGESDAPADGEDEDEGEDEDGDGDSEPETVEPESSSGEILENGRELERHFREHFAEEAIQAVTAAVVAGDIPGKNLSRQLLSKLKSTVDGVKRGFPLPMIQQLCREFEKEGLRFFKRGKKTLYVSVTRPRSIKNEEAFTDRIRAIVDFVRKNPRARVIQMLDALVPDYQPPRGGETFEEHHLTQAEHDVLADLRWLTMEGYVIEFPSSELLLGGRDPAGKESGPPSEKTETPPEGEKKPPKKKKRSRNAPRPNPLKAKVEELPGEEPESGDR